MKIFRLPEIKKILPQIDLIPPIESGFVDYSAGKAVVPPVGELILEKGEVHIKYGFIKQDKYYVIKIASGFYGNPQQGLPSGNGMMLLFSQQTGMTECILLDEGYLTDVRTAVAGAISAKYLAPKKITKVGIVGTGVQAHLQLEYLMKVVSVENVLVWGRNQKKISKYINDMSVLPLKIESTLNCEKILNNCNLIVTTTPSTKPLLHAENLRPGTHITAVGSDTAAKQELDAEILNKADVVVADSIQQCLQRGEIFQAIRAKNITEKKLVELGNIIQKKSTGRINDAQITVADLTGVAVQDIKIAEAVFEKFLN